MSGPGVVVGVDLGGTKTAAAVVGADGTLGPVRTVPTRAADGPDAVFAAVETAVRAAADGQPVTGVGIGTAGAVDPDRGVVVSSTATFGDWVGADIPQGVRRRLGPLSVSIRNDVDAHALGECWRGAGAGVASVFLVAVGTGIGGAVVLDGRLHTGAHHLGGEIAHIPTVGAQGLACPCGRSGHLEGLAAGPAIVRRFHRDGGDPALTDAREVVAAAEVGDHTAARVVTEAAAGLGRTLAGIVTTLDPERVIVGGGLAQAGPRWWSALEETFRAELVEALAEIPLIPAVLGPQAAILGAARPLLDPVT